MKNNNYSCFLRRNNTFEKEKRINNRVAYNSDFKIVSVNSNTLNIRVLSIDISISGLSFISNINFEINDILEITFNYNNITMSAIAKVVHSNIYDDGFFIGCQFIAIQNLYRELLKEYLL